MKPTYDLIDMSIKALKKPKLGKHEFTFTSSSHSRTDFTEILDENPLVDEGPWLNLEDIHIEFTWDIVDASSTDAFGGRIPDVETVHRTTRVFAWYSDQNGDEHHREWTKEQLLKRGFLELYEEALVALAKHIESVT